MVVSFGQRANEPPKPRKHTHNSDFTARLTQLPSFRSTSIKISRYTGLGLAHCGLSYSICPLFSSPPWGIWSSRTPTPGNLPSGAKKKKMQMPGGGGEGGAGLKWNWLMHNVQWFDRETNSLHLLAPEPPKIQERNRQVKTAVGSDVMFFNYT